MHALCAGLVRRGHVVSVLTGYPNYPQGKIYDGYRQTLYQKEIISGVEVIRIPLYPDRSRSFIKRSLNNLSFPLIASIIGPLLNGKADIMLVQHPPITLGIPAYIISRLHEMPFVFIIQDMWPETLYSTGMVSSKFILRKLSELAMFTYRNAKVITVISPGFKRNLTGKGIPSEKIEVIYNWAYETEFPLSLADVNLAKELGMEGYFNILYAGNIGPAQGLDNVIKAASLLTDIKGLQFVLLGEGVDRQKLEEMAKERCLKNVKLLHRMPMGKMPAIYALAEAVMVHLTDDPLFEITIPGKTQSCLLSGRPIIASVNGDAADLIAKAEAGLVVKAMNPDELASAVRQLYNMPSERREAMGKAGRSYYFQHLSPEVQIDKYEKLFEEILSKEGI